MIHVEVTGLSPIMVGWTEKDIFVDLPETGDNSQLGLWAAILALCSAGMLALRGRKRRAE